MKTIFAFTILAAVLVSSAEVLASTDIHPTVRMAQQCTKTTCKPSGNKFSCKECIFKGCFNNKTKGCTKKSCKKNGKKVCCKISPGLWCRTKGKCKTSMCTNGCSSGVGCVL